MVAVSDFELEVIVLIDVDMAVLGQEAALGLLVQVSWHRRTVKLFVLEVRLQTAGFEDQLSR